MENNFAFQNGCGLPIKPAKNTKITAKKSSEQLAVIIHWLIFGRVYYRKDIASEIWGAYFWEGLFLGGLLSEFYGTLFSVEKTPLGCYIHHGVSGTCKYVCNKDERRAYGMSQCMGRVCCYKIPWRYSPAYCCIIVVYRK